MPFLGLVFGLASDVDELSWQRQTQFSYYPSSHIGRPQGVNVAVREQRNRHPDLVVSVVPKVNLYQKYT